MIHIKLPRLPGARFLPCIRGMARDAVPGGATRACRRAAVRSARRILIYLNAVRRRAAQHCKMWHPITSAPADRDIELAVLDQDGQHALIFPCRRIAAGWMNAQSGERLDVRPTHWRDWADHGNANVAQSGR